MDAEARGRADQAQGAAAGPRNDLGAERLDLGADVVWAQPKLAQPGQQWALEHSRRHPLRLVGNQADERDAGPDHQYQGDKNYDTRRQAWFHATPDELVVGGPEHHVQTKAPMSPLLNGHRA